jgi:hypothetical protein
MGYFSNGTEGDSYEAAFCFRCIHQNGKDGQSGCAIWLAHMLHNYEECNKPESILHLLIRRGDWKKGEPWNFECEMFVEKPFDDKRQMHLFTQEVFGNSNL